MIVDNPDVETLSRKPRDIRPFLAPALKPVLKPDMVERAFHLGFNDIHLHQLTCLTKL